MGVNAWSTRRTPLSYTKYVTGREFVRRVSRIGRERGVTVRLDDERGKGSHVTLHYGSRKTIVKDRGKELGPGLLQSMIRDLGLERADFR